jgi:hypothetical protein
MGEIYQGVLKVAADGFGDGDSGLEDSLCDLPLLAVRVFCRVSQVTPGWQCRAWMAEIRARTSLEPERGIRWPRCH